MKKTCTLTKIPLLGFEVLALETPVVGDAIWQSDSVWPPCSRVLVSICIQAFRTEEGVDIAEDGSGYTVGWNRAGEYMRYTVEVDYTGKHRTNAAASSSFEPSASYG